jgi:hypothetical protein
MTPVGPLFLVLLTGTAQAQTDPAQITLPARYLGTH